jgi:murein DD-endopeptidase MepM/ murein hydrolase activator NlpD
MPAAVVPTPSAQALPTAAATVPATAVTRLPTAVPAPLPTVTPTAVPAIVPAAAFEYSYPIGTPGQPLGDGFFIRHGFSAENTWYNPGYWHTGEDWYAVAGDTAGARVYAIAAGEVVYAGANYPGRVVIVKHAADLYSMYGHLDPALRVRQGQRLARGDLIGTVLRRGDSTPNHLHFELRAFLTSGPVNGAQPRYGFRCGVNCPPGPGYWPIKAPDLPSDLGWRNPTHAINLRMLPPGAPDAVVVSTRPISPSVALWSAPPAAAERRALGTLELRPGERFPLLGVYAGDEDTRQTSALAYRLWYQIQLPDARAGWVQAAVPSAFETGGDGRPSSIYFNFFPAALPGVSD